MKQKKELQELLHIISESNDPIYQNTAKEIEKLFAQKEKRLQRIIDHSDRQQMAIVHLNEELDEYKDHLEKKVQEEMAKRKAQETLLIEQSRLAAIAEMIDSVAHQWKQPLNLISMQTYILLLKANKKEVITQEIIADFNKELMKQVHHMVDTLDNFRSFFRPATEAETFSAKESVDSVMDLIRDDLMENRIKTSIEVKKDFDLYGNSNEFKHILLNLISNTKYAFNDNAVEQRVLYINILGDNKSIEVVDNAGGIPENIIDRIFDMHVTSKGDKGTGIGLYMVQQIAHKFQGEMSVENVEDGAKFIFRLKENDVTDH